MTKRVLPPRNRLHENTRYDRRSPRNIHPHLPLPWSIARKWGSASDRAGKQPVESIPLCRKIGYPNCRHCPNDDPK